MTNEDLKNLEIRKGFDFDKYIGLGTTIKSVELGEIETKDFGKGLQKVRQVIVTSENLNNENEKEFFIKEWISLKYIEDEDKFIIPDTPRSKAMKFLKYFDVKTLDELQGKKCQIVKRLKDNGDYSLGISHG